MKKIIFIFIICTLIRLFIIFIFDDTKHVNKFDTKTLKVINITKNDNKTNVILKNKNKYIMTIYTNFKYKEGDYIKVKGNIYTPSCNTVFNLFNYRKYLLSKNIKYQIKPSKISLYKKNNNLFYKLKRVIINYIEKRKSKDYLKAFIIGDKSDIDITYEYQKIGISHLLSISGMHISLFLYFLNKLFKKIKYKDLIIYLFLIFELFITVFLISYLRCFIFIILKDINKKLNLNIKNIYLLSIEFMLFIIYNPYFIYNIGFIFSFTITFFILLSDKLLKNKNYLYRLFIITIISFLASIPILIYNFFEINFLSIVFNFIFVPIFSFIIFPLGILSFVFPFIDQIFFYIINVFENIIVFLSKIKIFNFDLSKPNLFIIFLYYIFLYLTITKNKKTIILYFVLLIININFKYFDYSLKITYLDVGQGDSTLIKFPKNKTCLIDTGGIYNNSGIIIKNKIKPYLNSIGIKKIEFLILTHGGVVLCTL